MFSSFGEHYCYLKSLWYSCSVGIKLQLHQITLVLDITCCRDPVTQCLWLTMWSCALNHLLSGQILCKAFFFFKFFNLFFILFLNFTNCISFAKYQNESATGIPVFPILNPPPSSLPIPSLWVVPVHQPQASSIVHRTWTGNSFHT